MKEVGKCQKCGKSIDETHENSWCIKCGEPLPEDVRGRLPRLAAVVAVAQVSPDDSALAQALANSPVVNRYRDAFRVGAALVGLGDGIKAAGAILGGIIVVVSFSEASGAFLAAGIFLGVTMGALFWVSGVMVAAQGQILRATLDTAVAASRFLTDTERAGAMGLPQSAVDRSHA